MFAAGRLVEREGRFVRGPRVTNTTFGVFFFVGRCVEIENTTGSVEKSRWNRKKMYKKTMSKMDFVLVVQVGVEGTGCLAAIRKSLLNTNLVLISFFLAGSSNYR